MSAEAWKTVAVYVEPFPRAPFTATEFSEDEPFMRIADAACPEPGCGPDWWKWEIGFGSNGGVLQFSFFDDEETGEPAPSPDEAAGYVARLLTELGIEAADIWGRVEWTVMGK